MHATVKSLLVITVIAALIWALLDGSRDARQMSEGGLRQAREAAVILARQGDTGKALKRLRSLRKLAPQDDALLWDYMAVLSWAGEHRELDRLRHDTDMRRAPDWLRDILAGGQPAGAAQPAGTVAVEDRAPTAADDAVAADLPALDLPAAILSPALPSPPSKAAAPTTSPARSLRVAAPPLLPADPPAAAQQTPAGELVTPVQNADDSAAEALEREKQAVNQIAWRGKLDQAQSRSEQLVRQAPEDLGAGLQLAQIYRWQGWPRRAALQRQQIAMQEPDSGPLLRAGIRAATDEGRYADAASLLARYRQLYPDDPGGPVLLAELDTAAGARLRADWRRAWTDGDGINRASNSSAHGQTLYSPAWRRFNDTRLFVYRHHNHAEYQGGRGSIRRHGLGVQTEHRDWGLTLGWHQQTNASEAAGLTLAGHLELSDHWGMDIDLQEDTDRTPIRAAINDIEARSAGIAVRHHRHDGHHYRARATQTRFTDSNDRLEIDLSGSQPLYRDAPHRLLLRQYIGFSSNSKTDTPYFSPKSTSAAQVQLDYTGRLNAWPGDHWEHNVVAGVGVATQSDFSAAPIWDLTYEHRYRFSRQFSASAGLQWLDRMYDGNNEQTRAIFARFDWRFQ